MARRQELTIEIVTQIAEEVREGHWPHIVARKLGVSKGLYEGWMEVGEDAHVKGLASSPKDDLSRHLCRQLYERIQSAESACEMEWLTKLRLHADAGKTTWNGYAHLLATRFYERWRKRDTQAEGDANIETQIKKWLEAQPR